MKVEEKVCHVLMIQSMGFTGRSGGRGSVVRIKAAREFIQANTIPTDSLLVWPQGYQRWFPKKKKTPESQSLGENLLKVCMDYQEFRDMQVIQQPLSWGSLNDILTAYTLVQGAGCTKVHFHFVSDRSHMRRIKMIWRLTHPQGWTAEFHRSKHVLSLCGRYIIEPCKYMKDRIRLLFR